MKKDLKFLNKREKRLIQQKRRSEEVTEEMFGITVRHHTWHVDYINEVFGVAA